MTLLEITMHTHPGEAGQGRRLALEINDVSKGVSRGSRKVVQTPLLHSDGEVVQAITVFGRAITDKLLESIQ